MERKEFLKSIGAGAAFAVLFPCINGCSNDSGDQEVFEVSDGVDFTVDLNSDTAAPLAENGGFIFVKSNPDLKYLDIVVARNLEGNIVAASNRRFLRCCKASSIIRTIEAFSSTTIR